MESIPFAVVATVVYVVVPANPDERLAAETVLAPVWHSDIFWAKGFLGADWQADQLVGLTTHVIAKMTSHLLKRLLRRQFGIDVQSFTATANAS